MKNKEFQVVKMDFRQDEKEGDQTVVTPAAVCFSGAVMPVSLVRQTWRAARMVVARKRALQCGKNRMG